MYNLIYLCILHRELQRKIYKHFFFNYLLSCTSVPLECEFESPGNCQLIQDHTDDFDWSYGNDSTPNFYTGPSGGADGQDGFLYIEASDPQKPNDKAR